MHQPNSNDGKIVLYLKGHIEATEGMIQCLKSCLIENLLVNSSENLTTYGSISDKIIHPLNVKRIQLLTRSTNDVLLLLHYHLDKRILASEIRWILSYEMLANMLDDSKTLQLFNDKKLKKLNLVLPYDDHNSFKLNPDILEKWAIRNILAYDLTLEMTMKNVGQDFCKNYYNMFKEMKQPSSLISSIIIYGVESEDIQKINHFIESYTQISKIQVSRGETSCDLKRKDSWIFRIILNTKRQLKINIIHE